VQSSNNTLKKAIKSSEPTRIVGGESFGIEEVVESLPFFGQKKKTKGGDQCSHKLSFPAGMGSWKKKKGIVPLISTKQHGAQHEETVRF